jgi:hypothetical protein
VLKCAKFGEIIFLVGSADGVLVLENNGRRDYINIEKVLAAWEA